MSITIEQIDELRERTGVNYTDAKEALESCNGDMLEAIVYLEKNKKARCSKTKVSGAGFSDKISDLLRKGSNTRIKMYKQENVIFNISVNIAALIGIILIPAIALVAVGLLLALLTGHRFKLESSSSDTSNINATLDKMTDTVNHAKEKLAESISSNSTNNA